MIKDMETGRSQVNLKYPKGRYQRNHQERSNLDSTSRQMIFCRRHTYYLDRIYSFKRKSWIWKWFICLISVLTDQEPFGQCTLHLCQKSVFVLSVDRSNANKFANRLSLS